MMKAETIFPMDIELHSDARDCLQSSRPIYFQMANRNRTFNVSCLFIVLALSFKLVY